MGAQFGAGAVLSACTRTLAIFLPTPSLTATDSTANSSSNIAVKVAAGTGYVTVMRVSDSAVLFTDGLAVGREAACGGWVNVYQFLIPSAAAAEENTERHTVDLLFATYPAAAPLKGPARATAILNGYADAVGHVPAMQKEICGYWHSKDNIGSQEEAGRRWAGFRAKGLPVDVLVLDYKYKACDA